MCVAVLIWSDRSEIYIINCRFYLYCNFFFLHVSYSLANNNETFFCSKCQAELIQVEQVCAVQL